MESSILLFVQGGQFQGVTQERTDVRAAVSPPALLLGYDLDPVRLGIPVGPLELVAGGDELPTPLWAYVLEEDGWRETTHTLRDNDLYRQARVARRSICACAAEGKCFGDADPQNCQECPEPGKPTPPSPFPTAPPANCPQRWTATLAPGGHFHRCEPPVFPCEADGVATASECRSLIVECADGFPSGDYDSYVRPGSSGNGTRADPFGDLDAARAAAGDTPARIALASGSYQLPDPYQGPPLELYACDPRLSTVGGGELASGLRLEGVGFTELTTRRAQLELKRSLGDRLDLFAQSTLIAQDVELGSLSVRSSTASGSGWRVRSELLLAGSRLEVRDLRASSVRVTNGSARLEEASLEGGLQVTAPGRLDLVHGQVIGRQDVALSLAGSVNIEDSYLKTNNATIAVSRGEATFSRTWFIGPVVVLGTDSEMTDVVFEIDGPTADNLPRLFHFRTNRSATLEGVYATGESVSGLMFTGEASSLRGAWLQTSGGSVISVGGNGQLDVEDVRVEGDEGAATTCAAATVTSSTLRGQRVEFATAGVGLLAQINANILLKDVRLVHTGTPGKDCGGPFIPLANLGVGAAGYDASELKLSHFEILDFPRGVVLNASGGELEDGRIATPIAFNVSAAATEDLGLLRRVLVEDAALVCEGVDQ